MALQLDIGVIVQRMKGGGRGKKGGRSEIYMFQATRRDGNRLIHILEIKFMNTEIKKYVIVNSISLLFANEARANIPQIKQPLSG